LRQQHGHDGVRAVAGAFNERGHHDVAGLVENLPGELFHQLGIVDGAVAAISSRRSISSGTSTGS
jgi:hypothetical protein